MTTKIYCLVVSGGEYEDMSMTLSFNKALEWLKKHSRTGQILEYSLENDAIKDIWDCIWEYDKDGNLKQSAQ